MQGTALANGAEGWTTDWNTVDWCKVEKTIANLRRRIFRASREGDYRKVRSLQKLMLRSRANALLSVRRVTQSSTGKNTPGVDKLVVKTPKARSRLVDQIRSHQPWRASPARRVYIPKRSGKLRPLGIPTVKDRVMQAIVKNALEPEWEAHFEPSSYGFRPGRSCHDAIGKIYNIARPNKRKKWVLDADIEGAFDNINHEKLLEVIGDFPARELIRQWLKAGYMEEGSLQETESGTPQGGVASPLLANIALHGMEEAIGVRYDNKGELRGKRAMVRYADDLVVFCESEEDTEEVSQLIQSWLKDRGLTLSPYKTQILHLAEGFDFLGFNIKHYRSPWTSKSGYKLLIKPSKESVQDFKHRLKREWMSLKGTNANAVIRRLNPIIRGWANYFRVGVSSEVFSDLDYWINYRARRWAKFSHPTKPKKWWQRKYWGRFHPRRNDRWVFGDKNSGFYLLKLSWFPIERHELVRGAASPDDPELKGYWHKRAQRRASNLKPRRRGLAEAQRGKCVQCGSTLFNGEELQEHHIIPRSEGGSDEVSNRQLIHLYCHQQITAKRVKQDAQ